MKKVSGLLAAVLVFVAVATAVGPVQEVQAFSEDEINYSDYNWYSSSKAGSRAYFSMSLNYSTAGNVDVTGWKAALCPLDNITLSGAVVTFDLSNDNKTVNDQYSYARVSLDTTLPSDIPEGAYKQVIFDADGGVAYEAYSARQYINKTVVNPFSCDLMNNDGYAYAYVYADNVPLSASTYPTFYAADKATAVTSFSDYATEVNEYGDTVHVYRLNILDESAFALGSDGRTTLYYKVGTPNVSVSGNDASNDGGLGMMCSDADGFHYTSIFNLNDYIQRNNLNITASNPFGNGSDAADNDEDDDDDDDDEADTQSAAATVNGQQIAASVTGIQSSDVPEIQAATNNLVNWVNQIASQPTEVINILKQYAPSMNVSGVTAGGTLDITIPNNTDISAGARITFTNDSIAANVRSGDKVVVLHVKHDGTIEYLPAVAGDGNITATFTSLSPVAWFKVDASGNTSGVSPKTGMSFWDFLLDLFR